jgi:hypothetical protein
MAVKNNLSPVEGTNPSGPEGRGRQRFRVLLNAELISTTDEQSVKVRDISQTGAMIEAQRPIAKAKDVILRRGEIEYFAEIAWVDGNQCGLVFDAALSEAEMMAFVQTAAKRASFVPEPFKDVAIDPLSTPPGWTAADAFRNPVARGVFGR